MKLNAFVFVAMLAIAQVADAGPIEIRVQGVVLTSVDETNYWGGGVGDDTLVGRSFVLLLSFETDDAPTDFLGGTEPGVAWYFASSDTAPNGCGSPGGSWISQVATLDNGRNLSDTRSGIGVNCDEIRMDTNRNEFSVVQGSSSNFSAGSQVRALLATTLLQLVGLSSFLESTALTQSFDHTDFDLDRSIAFFSFVNREFDCAPGCEVVGTAYATNAYLQVQRVVMSRPIPEPSTLGLLLLVVLLAPFAIRHSVRGSRGAPIQHFRR